VLGKLTGYFARLVLLALILNATGRESGNAQTIAPAKRLGILMGGAPCPSPSGPAFWKPLLQGLAARGWVEGRTLTIDCVSAGGRLEQAPMLARELVTRRPDVLLGAATLTVRALAQATTEIPIVTMASDPVRAGIVSNLAHPETNVTGLAPMTYDLTAKRIQLLKEVLPSLTRLAIFYAVRLAPDTVDNEQMTNDVIKATKALGISWKAFYPTSETFEQTFGQIDADRFDAVLVWSTAVAFPHREEIARLALQHRLPTISDAGEYASQGLLLTYGTDIAGLFADSVEYIDKLLQGSRPADLPLQQPTKFSLVINLKTAKALGIGIPSSVLIRSDEIIE